MNVKPEIENINDFLDYKKKTDAEFNAAIRNIEFAIEECFKKCDFIGALKLFRLKMKFEKLQNKKIAHENKEDLKSLFGKR